MQRKDVRGWCEEAKHGILCRYNLSTAVHAEGSAAQEAAIYTYKKLTNTVVGKAELCLWSREKAHFLGDKRVAFVKKKSSWKNRETKNFIEIPVRRHLIERQWRLFFYKEAPREGRRRGGETE